MNARLAFVSIALLASAFAANASTPRCTPAQIKPATDRLVIDGAQDALLGEADDAARPSAWQGPMKSGMCMVEMGIIEGPFFSAGKGRVYVTTYSGAVRNVVLVDFAACKVVWRSKPFTGEVNVTEGGLKLGRRRIRIDGQCIPMEKS